MPMLMVNGRAWDELKIKHPEFDSSLENPSGYWIHHSKGCVVFGVQGVFGGPYLDAVKKKIIILGSL